MIRAALATLVALTATALVAPSAAAQAHSVVKVQIDAGAVTVAVNGHSVGTLTGFGRTADITRYAHPGVNRLRVSWSAPANGWVNVGTSTGGSYRRVSVMQVYREITAKPGSKSQTFTLPDPHSPGSQRPAPGSVGTTNCVWASARPPRWRFTSTGARSGITSTVICCSTWATSLSPDATR